MPLKPEQREALEAAAKARGLDPAKLIARAESRADKPEEGKTTEAGPEGGKSDPPKVFAYNMGLLKAHEMRAYMGFSERVADDDLFVGEFLAKHGGAPATAAPAASTE